MIKFRCSNCGHKLGVPSTYVGKTVRCPHCQTGNRIQAPPSEEEFQEQAFEGEEQDDGLGALAAAAGGSGGVDELAAAFQAPESSAPDPIPSRSRSTARQSEPVQMSAPETAPVMSAPPSPNIRHTKPPDYTALKVGAFVIYGIAGLVLLIAFGVAVISVVGGASSGIAEGVAGGIASAAVILFAGTFYAIVLCIGAAALQALRDIARNSWYHHETVALLRAGR